MISQTLLKRVKSFEKSNKLIEKLDQNFLVDSKAIEDFIKICQIKKKKE